MVCIVGKFPVWMTQKPRKRDFGELKSKKKISGEHAPDLRRSRKSVSIYPRSAPDPAGFVEFELFFW